MIPLVGDVLAVPAPLARLPGLFEVPVARRPAGLAFVYCLCARRHPAAPGWPDELECDYVGQTMQLAKRLADHEQARARLGQEPFERVFAVGVPVEDAAAVEEALIRLIQPLYNRPRRPDFDGRIFRPQDAAALRGIGYELGHQIGTTATM